MKEDIFDIIVIGGGIVGLAAAYKLKEQFPSKTVLVLEKEKEVAGHQTGRNSGVIHSGIYYKPGSYKAKNCVEGRRELVQFAKEHKIPHDICGKIIVATQQSELDHMYKVFSNGQANDVEGISLIGPEDIRDIEPHCRGIAGIHVPCTGIISYAAVSRKYEELINKAAGQICVLKGVEVLGFEHNSDLIDVSTSGDSFRCRYLIACAGLQSDRIAKLEGSRPEAAIVGFRGDYYDLTEKGHHKVKNLIYPVPNPKFPFLGVHFTRMIDETIECGPNAVFVFKREGYGKTDFSLKDTADAFSFPGTWRFFAKNWRFGVDEYLGAFSKRMFLKRLNTLIPGLELDDIKPGRSGVRAMALAPEGNMIDDFKIELHGNAIHVLNAPSPAATASLAIGSSIKEMAREQFHLI